MKENKLNTEKVHEISVALLMKDPASAQLLSKIFREVAIVPYCYENLKDFWSEVQSDLPDLCLVDIEAMSEDGLFLNNHPLVETEKLPLAFYCKESSKPLMLSTYNTFNFGTIFEDQNLKGQVKNLLKRMNKFNESMNSKAELESRTVHVEKQMKKLIAGTEGLKEKNFYNQELTKLVKLFNIETKATSFFEHVSQTFSNYSPIEKFTLLELSHSRQKLLSPKNDDDKYSHIPSIWLGETNDKGVDFFAQNLAGQVCLDIMGGNLVTFLIKGKNGLVQSMIVAKMFDEVYVNEIDWSFLEQYLSGLYAQHTLAQIPEVSLNERSLTPWALYTKLDDYFLGPAGDELSINSKKYGLIDIDFSELISLTKQNRGMRFYWNRFYQDFFSGLETHRKIDFQLSPMGIDHAALLVDKEDLERIYSEVRSYVLRFSFWRYFDNPESILATNMKPSVRIVPVSKEAYERFLTGKNMYTKEFDEPSKISKASEMDKAIEEFDKIPPSQIRSGYKSDKDSNRPSLLF